MKSAALCIDKPTLQNRETGFVTDYTKQAILNRLKSLRHGELVIIDGDERYVFGKKDRIFPKSVTVTVTDPAFYTRVLMQGALGGGEAYINGCWQCDDLTAMVELFLCNRQHIGKIGPGMKWLVKPVQLLQRFLRRNSLKGSRRNIEAHYDLGNELFELFLDDTMMYSCGIFSHPHVTLQEASEAKLETICRKLQLKPTDHVLEIGTGWGGFALYAARHYGCQVTTTTISKQQYDYARKRIREAGLEGRINLRFDDYRELSGSYDKLVSIEMIEAVGHRYFDTYFSKCSELLKPDGMMLLQSITIADQRYPAAKNSIDFIQRYIFPGGCLPSNAALGDAIARNTDMRIFHLHDIGPHYATTLRHWRKRFFANIEKVYQLGYPEQFIRMWEYYLAYCEGGFRQQVIGTVQLLLVKPQCRRNPLTGAEY
ncbi:MAG TPA: cyclopropane-fatty-acyl-phospholipid synthase family protein [Gammaproteobacteria bacterium]|nr:cyclopropane-fatty-acyl-phospholipid synthase family protein [Gammaproteobacteria bacterium]